MKLHVSTAMRMRLRGTRLARCYAHAHVWLYRATRGRLGARIRIESSDEGPPVLLLGTTGRKTGKPRTTPLIYLVVGDDLVVIAANAGHRDHPAWCLNLRADPRATVEIGDRDWSVVAEEQSGDQRRELWDRFLVMYAGLGDYERDVGREIPVIVLRRAQEPGAASPRANP